MIDTPIRSIRDYKPAQILKNIIAPLIPYLTIGIGLLVLHNVWIAILSYHLGMAIILLISRTNVSLKQLLKSDNFKLPLVTGLLGLGGGILLYFSWPWLSIPKEIARSLQNIGLNEASWPFFLGYFIVVNSWIEEYYWRGYLGSDSKKIILNDLLFSGYHLVVLAGKVDAIWLIVIFSVLTAAAWFWRQTNRWAHGMLPSAASHLAADIAVIITIYLLVMRI
jgi:hypothetical protein